MAQATIKEDKISSGEKFTSVKLAGILLDQLRLRYLN